MTSGEIVQPGPPRSTALSSAKARHEAPPLAKRIGSVQTRFPAPSDASRYRWLAVRFIPRAVFFALSAALVMAACSAGPSIAPNSPSGGTAPPTGWASAVGSTPIIPILASSELARGKERFLFILTDQAGHVISDPSATAHVRFFDLARDPNHPAAETDAPFYWLIEGARGLYRAPVTFTEAGQWGAEFIVARTGTPAASPPPSPDPIASPVTVRVIFTVREHSSTPAIGDPAPPADTPTLATAGGDPRKISTDPQPDPRLYQLSIRDALAAKQPFLVIFGTPAFCQTATCGPTLQIVRGVLADYPNLNAIHVEPYVLAEKDGSLQPVLDASGNLQPVPAVTAWGLNTEPYTFLVGADGTVQAKFEGAIDPVELRAAIDALPNK